MSQIELFDDRPAPKKPAEEWRKRTPERLAGLRALMRDGEWHTADELRKVAGWRFGARLYELRRGEDGGAPMAIKMENKGGGVYRYRATL